MTLLILKSSQVSNKYFYHSTDKQHSMIGKELLIRDSFTKALDTQKSPLSSRKTTTTTKKNIYRKSQISTTSNPLMSREIMEKQINTKRSSFSYQAETFLEDDFTIDQFHAEGYDDLLKTMNDYVDREYERKLHRPRLRLKKYWKKVRGKELNEQKEKEEIRKKFILEHLTEEQRKLFAEELNEAKVDEDEDNAEANNPKFEIIPMMVTESQGTCK